MDSLLKSNPTTTTTTGGVGSSHNNKIDNSHVPSLYNDNDLLVIDASIKPLVPGLLDNLDITSPGTNAVMTAKTNNHGLSKCSMVLLLMMMLVYVNCKSIT